MADLLRRSTDKQNGGATSNMLQRNSNRSSSGAGGSTGGGTVSADNTLLTSHSPGQDRKNHAGVVIRSTPPSSSSSSAASSRAAGVPASANATLLAEDIPEAVKQNGGTGEQPMVITRAAVQQQSSLAAQQQQQPLQTRVVSPATQAASAAQAYHLDNLSRSYASESSQHEYAMSHQTILLFDWDDTLCPSSFCRHTLSEQLICKVWQECCNLPEEQAAATTPSKKNAGAAKASSSSTSGASGGQHMPGTYIEAWDATPNKESPNKKVITLDSDDEDGAPSSPTNGTAVPPLSAAQAKGQKMAREYFDQLVHQKHKTQLDAVARMLVGLLRKAKTMGRVVIVTNAETGWIELSCKAWLSSALPEVLSCKLVSARSSYEQPSGSKSPAGWKADAFRDVVKEFYIKRSWKNIISIGDAPHEREAVFRIQSDANHPKCRVKSMKLQVRPKVSEVMRQMGRLAESLGDVIAADCNLDLEFIPDTAAFEDQFGSGKLF
ncbi:unnamed protein product [Amoebophrya sp. A120]|nr:unnamed protein product [Amoebophrya sp. A120]|eukprot:GSA120T00006142001.1